jgi:hypothetical protein
MLKRSGRGVEEKLKIRDAEENFKETLKRRSEKLKLREDKARREKAIQE